MKLHEQRVRAEQYIENGHSQNVAWALAKEELDGYDQDVAEAAERFAQSTDLGADAIADAIQAAGVEASEVESVTSAVPQGLSDDAEGGVYFSGETLFIEKAWREVPPEEKRTDNLVAENEEGDRRYGGEARAVLEGDGGGGPEDWPPVPYEGADYSSNVRLMPLPHYTVTPGMEGPSPPVTYIDEEGEAWDDLAREEQVALDDIVATQEWVDPEKLESMRGEEGLSLPTLLEVDGTYYVNDGHHRLLSQALEGGPIEALVIHDEDYQESKHSFVTHDLRSQTNEMQDPITPQHSLAKSHLHKHPSGRITKENGEYCDVPGHCFDTPSALGGHVASTGHEVEGEEVDVEDPATDRGLSLEETEEYSQEMRENVDWDAVKQKADQFAEEGKFENLAEKHWEALQEQNDLPASAYPFKGSWAGRTYDELGERMSDKMPEAIKAINGWSTSADQASTTPLWTWAAEQADNDYVHPVNAWRYDNAASDLEEDETDDFARRRVEAMRTSQEEAEQVEFLARMTQEIVREKDPTYDPETDTVKVYRGISGDMGEKLAGAAMSDEDENIQINHRALESWTADPDTARYFGQSVLEARIPVENILASWMSAPGLLQDEGEYVVANPEQAIYSTEDVHVRSNENDIPNWARPDDREETWNAWVKMRMSENDIERARLEEDFREEKKEEFERFWNRIQRFDESEGLDELVDEVTVRWREALTDDD